MPVQNVNISWFYPIGCLLEYLLNLTKRKTWHDGMKWIFPTTVRGSKSKLSSSNFARWCYNWPARLWDGDWILDSQGNAVPPLKYHVIRPLQHHHAVKHTAEWLEKWENETRERSCKQRVHSTNTWFQRRYPKEKGMKASIYPDISALVYNAVTLYIKEFRSPVRYGAPLGGPVLYGHGFSGSSHLKLTHRVRNMRRHRCTQEENKKQVGRQHKYDEINL